LPLPSTFDSPRLLAGLTPNLFPALQQLAHDDDNVVGGGA